MLVVFGVRQEEEVRILHKTCTLHIVFACLLFIFHLKIMPYFEQTRSDRDRMRDMENAVVSPFRHGKEQYHEGSQAFRFLGNFPRAQSN